MSRDRKDAPPISELTKRNVEIIAEMQRATESKRTLNERVADAFAAAIGSWPFLIIQSIILVMWIVLNVVGWTYHWDPYPFILLNLGLGFQSAYASPIILMSQNRQAALDARRNQLDLQINLLAEQENTEMLKLLRLLCEKSNIRLDKASEQALEQPTCPEEVIRQIEGAEQKLNSTPEKKRRGRKKKRN